MQSNWKNYLATVQEQLIKSGFQIKSGLTNQEVKAIEKEFGFEFPPDLKEFLSFCLPISPTSPIFPDWRNGNKESLKHRLAWPLDGICFDIEHNNFWPDSWGKRPESLKACFKIAKEKVEAAPKLIPIYGHRFISEKPAETGNPIFSVYQTDIIYYGYDLADYFFREFKIAPLNSASTSYKEIEFWTALVS
jgi:hypothetical protein